MPGGAQASLLELLERASVWLLGLMPVADAHGPRWALSYMQHVDFNAIHS